MPKDTNVIKIAAGFAIKNHHAGRPCHKDERRHHDTNIVNGIAARPSNLQTIATFAVSLLSSGVFNVLVSLAR